MGEIIVTMIKKINEMNSIELAHEIVSVRKRIKKGRKSMLTKYLEKLIESYKEIDD